MCGLLSFSLNNPSFIGKCLKKKPNRKYASFSGLDHNNVKVTCLWDNVRFHGDSSSTSPPAGGSSGGRGVALQRRGPIYTHWVRPKNQQTEKITEDYLNKIVNQQPDTDMKPLIKQIIFGVSQNDLTKVNQSELITAIL